MRRTVEAVDNRDEVRDFLLSSLARNTPEQAGLPTYGGRRRVPWMRREEVALLAEVSVDYYTRLYRSLTIIMCTAAPGSASPDALSLLASWAATSTHEPALSAAGRDLR